MHVQLVFDCGASLAVPRDWLLPSDVLNEMLGAADTLGNNICGSDARIWTIPVLNDKLEEWQLLLPLLEAVSSLEVSSHLPQQLADSQLASFSTASVILKLEDKYNMTSVLDVVATFLSGQVYSSAAADSGDITSIWYWLRIASRLTQPSLLQHYKRHIIKHRMVPNSTADVSGLHPNDLAELLVSFMQQTAAVRYKCLGCAGRHSTEVRLCSRCSFSPHIRV